jgi:hypothetical protein
MVVSEPIAIDVGRLPEIVRQGISPDTPSERRLLLARAMVPLSPEDLVPALAVLATDRSEIVSTAARSTLDSMPWGVLEHGIKQAADPGVLDFMAREVPRDGVTFLVATHSGTSDETIVHLASRSRGEVLEVIARNQMRQQRCPRIIEALYYNPETRMGTVSMVLESAVRLGIDLSHIPGYAEIVTSIFGADAVGRVTASAPAGEAVPPPDLVPPTDAAASGSGVFPAGSGADGMDDLAAELNRAMADAGLQAPGGEAPEGSGLDDDSFSTLLLAAMTTGEEIEKDEDLSKENPALWTKLNSLTVPQKVRLALLGNDFIRTMLIRDPRRVVYMSVMKSPKLTDRDIIGFSKNRALNDEIVRMIATNRDWTKIYQVKQALVANPKCPPVMAMQFLRALTIRDLKHISTSHDVPGYVARQAKQICQAREAGKRQAD